MGCCGDKKSKKVVKPTAQPVDSILSTSASADLEEEVAADLQIPDPPEEMVRGVFNQGGFNI